MIDIFICEDNEKQRSLIQKYVEQAIMIESFDMKIKMTTDDPAAILNSIRTTDRVGLYFLDINLNSDMNGLMLAQEIRKIDPRCFIVIITSHSEMSYMTFQYKVEAMDFIIKDNAQNIKTKIHGCIIDVYERYSSINNNIHKNYTIALNDKKINIDYKDILFFETSFSVHKIILHAMNRQIEFTAKLKEIENQLDDRFYRCHRSFIVNKDNIKEIDYHKRIINMVNGEYCLASIRMIKGIN